MPDEPKELFMFKIVYTIPLACYIEAPDVKEAEAQFAQDFLEDAEAVVADSDLAGEGSEGSVKLNAEPEILVSREATSDEQVGLELAGEEDEEEAGGEGGDTEVEEP